MTTTSKGKTSLPTGWHESAGRLVGAYKFRDFQQAMSFLVEVSFRAEVMEHHPDFHVHWNEVRFEVWSHDVDAVTKRDHALVGHIAKAAIRHGGKSMR